jgi:hypothetical protein
MSGNEFGIGTLVGIIVGGGITYCLNSLKFRQETQWKERQHVRNKLEEICLIIQEISSSNRTSLSKVLVDSKNIKDVLYSGTQVPFLRLQMLIDLYAKQLTPLFLVFYYGESTFQQSLLSLHSELIAGNTEELPPRVQKTLDLEKTIEKIVGSMITECAKLAKA